MEKIWKDVVGFEGKYLVSNYGDVLAIRYNPPKLLKQRVLPNGYYALSMCHHPISVHVVVAMAFLGHIRDKGIHCINHIDGNRLNNYVGNLEITTQRDNVHKGMTTKTGTSKHIGVSFYQRSKKWRADIKINGKSITIGQFDNEIDAKNAYDSALEHFRKHGKAPILDIKFKSKYHGVGVSNNKWMSYLDITIGSRIFLGYVKSEREAIDNLSNAHINYYYKNPNLFTF